MAYSDHLSWEQIQATAGSSPVKVHLHSPRTQAEGRLVYNVLDSSNKKIGTTLSAHLSEPSGQVFLGKLQQHYDKPVNPKTGRRGKTQNTVITGTPVDAPVVGSREEPVQARAGTIKVGENYVMNTDTKQVGDRVVVNRNSPSRTDVFARGVTFGSAGITAVFDD